jgi:hypothetical protein
MPHLARRSIEIEPAGQKPAVLAFSFQFATIHCNRRQLRSTISIEERVMALTKEQLSAVAHISGDLQLIACAGSGKTEVVALQIANLLAPKSQKGGGLLPANIVAFTFTEKASAELKKAGHGSVSRATSESCGPC